MDFCQQHPYMHVHTGRQERKPLFFPLIKCTCSSYFGFWQAFLLHQDSQDLLQEICFLLPLKEVDSIMYFSLTTSPERFALTKNSWQDFGHKIRSAEKYQWQQGCLSLVGFFFKPEAFKSKQMKWNYTKPPEVMVGEGMALGLPQHVSAWPLFKSNIFKMDPCTSLLKSTTQPTNTFIFFKKNSVPL